MFDLSRLKSRQHRHQRVRARVSGNSETPRLVVYRSLKHVEGQLIDDNTGQTLVSANDRELTKPPAIKIDRAKAVGELLAKKAGAQKITKVVFDRGGYRYHGRIRA